MEISFGTDGIRGKANIDLTPDLALELGKATRLLIGQDARVVIGRDTRISGSMLESSLSAGMTSSGVDVISLGVIPTPAVPLFIQETNASLGVVISASHNLAQDNGIKFFNRRGFKLPPEEEQKLARIVNEGGIHQLVRWREIGQVHTYNNADQEYESYLIDSVVDSQWDLSDFTIAIDCAHGATSYIAPQLFRNLGAEVTIINSNPTGYNINLKCGSTSMDELTTVVKESDADLGIAFDGDGDRALLVDEKGDVIDGDALMFITATWLKEQGRLDPPLVVSTVMSNLGLQKSLQDTNIDMVRTPVGDRYVAQEIEKSKALLGGEQCGHIIFRDCNTTGDGLVTALKIIEILKETGQTLSQLSSQMGRVPQILRNVSIPDSDQFSLDGLVGDEVNHWKEALGDEGRVLVRPSGTQDVVRVMVECLDQELAHQASDQLCQIIKQELNQ